MTMAMPDWASRTSVSLILAVTLADPSEELTCLLCHGSRVEWTVTYRTDSARITTGIHEACAARVERGGQP